MKLRQAISLVSVIILVGHVKPEVSQRELSQLMQTIWNLDTNRLHIERDLRLSLQGKTSLYSNVDRASERLFQTVPDLMKKSTFKKFISLLDNYNPLTHRTDRASTTEREEQRSFINSIMGTKIWQEVRTFLIKQGLVRSNLELSNELHRIWFTEYSRANGVTGSSGFEHVFVGELDNAKTQISGLHNWIQAYQLETSRVVNYMGYLKTDANNHLYELKLKQGTYIKSGNTMFMGTSPEYEMAVYTVCFLTRKNQCSFTLNGRTLTITVYPSYSKSIGTAYPRL